VADTTFAERLKSGLEWLQHGDLLIRLVGSIGLGQVVKALLTKYSHLDPIWIAPIWWLASAVFLAVLVWLGRVIARKKPEVIQNRPAATSGTMQFQVVENFYQTYDNQLLRECEDSVRLEAQKRQSAAEREAFLVKTLSAVIILAFFEGTWNVIFGSQIRALELLNKGIAKVEDLRPHYEQDLDKRPQYPFESWYGYLKEQVLIRQDGYNVAITVRGKEFLKYLVQCGRTDSDRKF
jgi:hypothetical protein